VSNELDRPLPEDVAAVDDSDLDEYEEPEAPFNCQAEVQASPSRGRDCGRPTDRAFYVEIAPGLRIWYALCDEHAELSMQLHAAAEEGEQD
jgi:hypothetical protein